MFLKRLKERQAPIASLRNTACVTGYNIDALGGEDVNAASYSPAALAFLGDAVYSLLVREFLLKKDNRPAGILHKLSTGFVSAAKQAKAARVLLPLLSEEEAAVYKRGRNAHSARTPKNQTGADYHSATGLEVLFGYLYLINDSERITELFGIITGELNE